MAFRGCLVSILAVFSVMGAKNQVPGKTLQDPNQDRGYHVRSHPAAARRLLQSSAPGSGAVCPANLTLCVGVTVQAGLPPLAPICCNGTSTCPVPGASLDVSLTQCVQLSILIAPALAPALAPTAPALAPTTPPLNPTAPALTSVIPTLPPTTTALTPTAANPPLTAPTTTPTALPPNPTVVPTGSVPAAATGSFAGQSVVISAGTCPSCANRCPTALFGILCCYTLVRYEGTVPQFTPINCPVNANEAIQYYNAGLCKTTIFGPQLTSGNVPSP